MSKFRVGDIVICDDNIWWEIVKLDYPSKYNPIELKPLPNQKCHPVNGIANKNIIRKATKLDRALK